MKKNIIRNYDEYFDLIISKAIFKALLSQEDRLLVSPVYLVGFLQLIILVTGENITEDHTVTHHST